MSRWRGQLRIWLAALVVVVALALFPACAAPTLPLPPPTGLVSAVDADGFVTVTGMARADAYVFVFNNRTETGVIGTADGAGDFTLRVEAQIDDSLSVWFMSGDETSGILDLAVLR